MAPFSFMVSAALLSLGDARVFIVRDVNVNETDDTDLQYRDVALDVAKLMDGEDCLGGWNAINPSFTFTELGQVGVAFRGLCLTKSGSHASWYSSLVVGTFDDEELNGNRTSFKWNSLELAPDPRYYGEDNNSTLQECRIRDLDIAKGPEDPRLITTPVGTFAIVTGYDLVETTGVADPECQNHGMLLYAAKVKTWSPTTFEPAVQLTFDGMGIIEKNWAMFSPSAADFPSAVVRAVYSIYPHRILKVDLENGDVNFIAESKANPVYKLAEQIGVDPGHFHGGSGVAWVDANPRPFYLSMMHVAVAAEDAAKEYWYFPYKFCAEPPYEIVHIGQRLPLTLKQNPAYGEMVAFVTTVMVDGDDLFVAYGAGDRESRTLRMPIDEFISTYFPSNLTETDEKIEIHVEKLQSGDVRKLELPKNTNSCPENISANCRGDLTPSVCRFC